MILVQILVVYILMDFLSGIYHILTDYGWNIKSQVELFQSHHETNRIDSPEFELTIWVALPVFLVALYFYSTFWIIISIFILCIQVPHYYSHQDNSPYFIRLLQDYHIFISSKAHAKHHQRFDSDFCIISGWCNPLLNFLFSFIKR